MEFGTYKVLKARKRGVEEHILHRLADNDAFIENAVEGLDAKEIEFRRVYAHSVIAVCYQLVPLDIIAFPG